jgi:hypothetical protein
MKYGKYNTTCKPSEEITFDVTASNGEIISFKQIFNPTYDAKHKITIIAPQNVQIRKKPI